MMLAAHWPLCSEPANSHTPSGAQASVAIYSLIETTKANGLSPYKYLQFVFETLPTRGDVDNLSTLLPWRWKGNLPA
ncbi:transposase domain-containing protein [Billgrantia lactosivorans]|uniref:transposase domain-containing protein n=1 Tax=Billgrantia lactosivorans TaxID=2185141 RepID=UPI003BEF0044